MGKTTEGQDFPKKPLLHFWHLQRCASKWVFVLKYQYLQFGGPAAAWFTPSICSLMTTCFPLYQVSHQSQEKQTETAEHWYAEHAVTLYRSLLLEDCGVHVLKTCFCFQAPLPLASPMFQPVVTGSFSSTSIQPLTLPTTTGLRKPGTSREQAVQSRAAEAPLEGECIYTCSSLKRGTEIYLCVINSELQLTDIFYINAIY